LYNWNEVEGIISEVLNWMKENSNISEEMYLNNIRKINLVLKIVKMVELDYVEDLKDFGLDRFYKLDDAQKAFVILASVDKRLSKENYLKTDEKNFKILTNTTYLNLVKSISRIKETIKKGDIENQKIIHIKKYINANPKIKRLGCGKFSLNFHKHVKNLLNLIYSSS